MSGRVEPTLIARLGPARTGRARATEDGAAPDFAELYALLYPKVLRALSGQCPNLQIALDISAETFAKAFEKRGSLRGTSWEAACGWVWAIARNELAQYHRRNAVETAALDRLGIERCRPSEDAVRELERLAAVDDMEPALTRAVAALPPDQQDVLRLRFHAERSNREIAQTLKLSEETVRKRLSRALRSLSSSSALREARKALDL
ncbi:MAG TPA: RNA polymerase sigma factor [Solirubrobacteraceae bacterium]|nr:RNA polymerase sigma factor [Solirubrobacteraceae bacterium]